MADTFDSILKDVLDNCDDPDYLTASIDIDIEVRIRSLANKVKGKKTN